MKSEIATFFRYSPNGMVFGNTHQGGGYDVVLLGQNGDAKIDVDRIESGSRIRGMRRWRSRSSRSVSQWPRPVVDLAAQGPQLRPWLADAQVNRDRNLRLQYLAGLGVNIDQRVEIYRGILAYRRYPDDLFIGSPERLAALRSAMLARPQY